MNFLPVRSSARWHKFMITMLYVGAMLLLLAGCQQEQTSVEAWTPPAWLTATMTPSAVPTRTELVISPFPPTGAPVQLTPSETVQPSPSVTPTLTIEPATIEPTRTLTFTQQVGQPTPCRPPDGWVIYTVQPGDTLYRISQAHGISVNQLMLANCLASTYIQTGWRLYVPYLPSPTPEPPTPTEEVIENTPTDTSTPEPSATLVITDTPTPEPSATPLITVTPLPATGLPVITDTPGASPVINN